MAKADKYLKLNSSEAGLEPVPVPEYFNQSKCPKTIKMMTLIPPFVFVYYLCVLCLYTKLAWYAGPGYITSTYVELVLLGLFVIEALNLIYWVVMNSVFDKHDEIYSTLTANQGKFCTWCLERRELNMKHCHSCDACRPEFHHHCFCTGTCVYGPVRTAQYKRILEHLLLFAGTHFFLDFYHSETLLWKLALVALLWGGFRLILEQFIHKSDSDYTGVTFNDDEYKDYSDGEDSLLLSGTDEAVGAEAPATALSGTVEAVGAEAPATDSPAPGSSAPTNLDAYNPPTKTATIEIESRPDQNRFSPPS